MTELSKIGPVNVREVRAYQMINKLHVDGRVGRQTFGHMIDRILVCEAKNAKLPSGQDIGLLAAAIGIAGVMIYLLIM